MILPTPAGAGAAPTAGANAGSRIADSLGAVHSVPQPLESQGEYVTAQSTNEPRRSEASRRSSSPRPSVPSACKTCQSALPLKPGRSSSTVARLSSRTSSPTRQGSIIRLGERELHQSHDSRCDDRHRPRIQTIDRRAVVRRHPGGPGRPGCRRQQFKSRRHRARRSAARAQGTLFGSGSLAGAVRYITNKPTCRSSVARPPSPARAPRRGLPPIMATGGERTDHHGPTGHPLRRLRLRRWWLGRRFAHRRKGRQPNQDLRRTTGDRGQAG